MIYDTLQLLLDHILPYTLDSVTLIYRTRHISSCCSSIHTTCRRHCEKGRTWVHYTFGHIQSATTPTNNGSVPRLRADIKQPIVQSPSTTSSFAPHGRRPLFTSFHLEPAGSCGRWLAHDRPLTNILPGISPIRRYEDFREMPTWITADSHLTKTQHPFHTHMGEADENPAVWGAVRAPATRGRSSIAAASRLRRR